MQLNDNRGPLHPRVNVGGIKEARKSREALKRARLVLGGVLFVVGVLILFGIFIKNLGEIL